MAELRKSRCLHTERASKVREGMVDSFKEWRGDRGTQVDYNIFLEVDGVPADPS